MAQQIQWPQWRAENETTRYPFSATASLSNGVQTLLDGTFIDAILYPLGGGPRLRLASAVVDHEQVTLFVGDEDNDELASVSFDVLNPPDALSLIDVYGRPAGLLVSESVRLGFLAAWGVGTFRFTADETEFAATVVIPTPAIGLYGLQLEDGTLFTDEVWLIGEDGVVFSQEQVTYAPVNGADAQVHDVIRMDVVGNPLFRRQLCAPDVLFQTPRLLKTVTFKDGRQRVQCGPNANGDVKITVNNDLANQTTLRVRVTPAGTVFEIVGSQLTGA